MSYEKKTLLYSVRRALSLHALLTLYSGARLYKGPGQSTLPQLATTRSTGNISVRTQKVNHSNTRGLVSSLFFSRSRKITAALSLHFQHLLWRLKAKRFKTYSKEEALYIVHINIYNEHICTEWHSQNVEVFRHFCGMLCLRHNTVHYFYHLVMNVKLI